MLNEKNKINELTGLKNLNALIESIDSRINNKSIKEFTVFVFEISNLTKINRYIDYSFGRKALHYVIEVAEKIFGKHEAYSMCTNEVAIVLENYRTEDTYAKGINFIEEFYDPVLINDIPVNIKIKCGIVNYPANGDRLDTFYKNLKTILLHSGDGIDNLSIINDSFASNIQEEFDIMCQIYHAINNDELRLEYQPKYSIRDNSIIGAEALLRWDDLGMSIGKVIDIVEKTDLINHITKWVTRKVINQLEEWNEKGISTKISINVSPKDFSNEFYFKYLIKEIKKRNIDPGMIELEITERCIYENKNNIILLLNKFIDSGFKITIDDYGTGYNSLKNPLLFPYDCIKIDRFFTNNIENKATYSLIEGIIKTANELGISVIAEGVENKTQYMILQSLGCHAMQGYYLSNPLKPEEYANLVIPSKVY
ncbi:EAL domain, c-di-GMP-specific phosphodiesterase class I (or its enzymatically inactive variant) [Dethiosulfatibacter aminovorans DSM 17477]|uniref:EAL domain, c-di-GMP-specific phosphodiesterase class I (Or its enzymatically inactive variant) n=1 Tax=Dethiosulfatibacter aminovorans DSM 17477 TaxID=1121476 RepID=A0A1M6JN38_9FIRM|nr:GGDEF domain-containing phosphodiesterase [Dethiosulfatibacter aminovorans]SHJ48044.1 EAL domain, c-di-GMP-specific phosphodiesterase class I (or its enzymatically inactive variant) [Dethiosulfatibacter aminovorans DSM 17477]